MKYVKWTDRKGIRHRSAIKEGMETSRPQDGYLLDPPDVIRGLNWDQIAIELHNALVDRDLFTMQDVAEQQQGITGAILGVLRRRVKELYRRK